MLTKLTVACAMSLGFATNAMAGELTVYTTI